MPSDPLPPNQTDGRGAPGHEHLEELLRKERQRRAKTLLRRRGIPARDLDDVLQDSNVAAWVQFRKGNYTHQSDESLARWFAVILRRKSHEYWRAQNDQPRTLLALADREASYTSDRDFALAVREVFDLLPAKHRHVLFLNRVGGFKTREIADRMERSPGRVGAMLADSKHRLAKQLVDHGLLSSLPPDIAASVRRWAEDSTTHQRNPDHLLSDVRSHTSKTPFWMFPMNRRGPALVGVDLTGHRITEDADTADAFVRAGLSSRTVTVPDGQDPHEVKNWMRRGNLLVIGGSKVNRATEICLHELWSTYALPPVRFLWPDYKRDELTSGPSPTSNRMLELHQGGHWIRLEEEHRRGRRLGIVVLCHEPFRASKVSTVVIAGCSKEATGMMANELHELQFEPRETLGQPTVFLFDTHGERGHWQVVGCDRPRARPTS